MAGKKKRDYSKTKRKDNGTPIQIRVSKELRATIERNAKACKLSISEYKKDVPVAEKPRDERSEEREYYPRYTPPAKPKRKRDDFER